MAGTLAELGIFCSWTGQEPRNLMSAVAPMPQPHLSALMQGGTSQMGEWLQSLVPWGTDIIIWAQSFSGGPVESLAVLFTWLGNEEFYLIVLPLVYWCIHKQAGVALAFLSMLSNWVNSAIKYAFAVPRPSDPRIRVPLPLSDPSFPSGHAQNAVAIWGYLALRFRHWLFWAVAAILILGISLSRIVLGVHYPQDVIGGWLIGLIVVAAYAWAAPPAGRWIDRQRMAVQLALAVVVPLLLIFLHPADTGGFYPNESAITPMSAMLGMGVGFVMERAYLRFDVRGPWWRRALRFLVGMVVTVILYAGPSLVIPDGLSHGFESGLRLVRYALLGWAVAFFCPWLFVRLRLASREAEPPSEA
jgi:membrane-associated phospholipid phosphatase